MFSLTQTAAAQSVRVTAPKRDVSRRCVVVFFARCFFVLRPPFFERQQLCVVVCIRGGVCFGIRPLERHPRSFVCLISDEFRSIPAPRDDDALKKIEKEKKAVSCLRRILCVSFFVASSSVPAKKETGRRTRAPIDRGPNAHG